MSLQGKTLTKTYKTETRRGPIYDIQFEYDETYWFSAFSFTFLDRFSILFRTFLYILLLKLIPT